MNFGREAFVRFDGNRLSDHNRDNVEQRFERIENKVRTARGRMRKSYVADKMSFSISWDELPEKDEETVDGHWGADSLIQFYRSTPGEFTMTLVNEDGSTEDYDVVFDSFSHSVQYRYNTYYYTISISLEEV